MNTTELSLTNLSQFLNKTIFFYTPDGCGLAKIKQVDIQKLNPITSDTLAGCNLDYAFKFIGDEICYCDGDRYINVVEVENQKVLQALIELNFIDGIRLIEKNQIKLAGYSITDEIINKLKSLGAVIEKTEEEVEFCLNQEVIIATF